MFPHYPTWTLPEVKKPYPSQPAEESVFMGLVVRSCHFDVTACAEARRLALWASHCVSRAGWTRKTKLSWLEMAHIFTLIRISIPVFIFQMSNSEFASLSCPNELLYEDITSGDRYLNSPFTSSEVFIIHFFVLSQDQVEHVPSPPSLIFVEV